MLHVSPQFYFDIKSRRNNRDSTERRNRAYFGGLFIAAGIFEILMVIVYHYYQLEKGRRKHELRIKNNEHDEEQDGCVVSELDYSLIN